MCVIGCLDECVWTISPPVWFSGCSICSCVRSNASALRTGWRVVRLGSRWRCYSDVQRAEWLQRNSHNNNHNNNNTPPLWAMWTLRTGYDLRRSFHIYVTHKRISQSVSAWHWNVGVADRRPTDTPAVWLFVKTSPDLLSLKLLVSWRKTLSLFLSFPCFHAHPQRG